MKCLHLFFSIDDEDIKLGDIGSIYQHRYSSYSSGSSICLKNNKNSNAYTLISNIILPNFLLLALEFQGFNPEEVITDKGMKKDCEYSKKILKREIYLNEIMIIFDIY